MFPHFDGLGFLRFSAAALPVLCEAGGSEAGWLFLLHGALAFLPCGGWKNKSTYHTPALLVGEIF